MRVQTFAMMVVACCATEVVAVEFSGAIDSNLVFSANETVEVAAGDAAYAMGTFQLGGTANGTISKTGGGTFNLSTAVINGKANGDSADGGLASLSVTGGTFRINTPTAVNSTFSGVVTVGENGAMEMDLGTVSTPQLTMGGGAFRMTGGTFTTKKVEGSGLIDIAGGTFTVLATNKFTVTGPMRVNLTGDGTLRSNTLVGGEGAEISLHADGGTLYPLPESSGCSYTGGTAYVGTAGMTIDTGDYYAWGVYWNMPIRSEPGVTDGGVSIMSSTYSATSVHGVFRLATDDIDIAGPIRVNNTHVMLLAEHYTVPIFLDNRSVVRAAVSPVVEVDRLEFTDDTGYIGVGIDQTTLEATLLKVNDFTPPKQNLGVTWYRSSTTSVSTPTNPVDILKFPASVDLPLSRITSRLFRSGYTPRFTMRTEDGWKILTLTAVPDAEAAAGANDPHTSDVWREGNSPWCLTNCLYSYTGGTCTVAGQMMADPKSTSRNAAISIPADVTLTLTGGADQQRGGIVKMGEGTLALTGDVGYNFSRNFSCYTALTKTLSQKNLAMHNADGVCVRSHHGSLNVGAGTLTIGTGTDNPQVSVYEGELNVGTATVSDNGGEKDAMLVMNSGTLSMLNTPITIGYGHGIAATQAHSPLISSFTLNGGYVDAWGVRVGHDLTERSAQDSRLIINGGTYLCRRWMALGTNSVTAGSVAKLVVNDGTLDIGSTAVAQGEMGDLRVGYPGNANLSTEFTVNGGEVTIHGGALFAPNAHHTVNLNGGTVFVKGGNFDASTSAGSSVLNWNGGVVKLGSSMSLQNFKTVNIGERGAILDISEGGSLCYLKLSLSQGILHVRGNGYRNGVQLYSGFQNCDGIVVERGGNILPRTTVPATCPILVKDGGVITGYYKSGKPHTLILGENETDITTVLGYQYTGETVTGWLTVTDTLTINGKVYVGGRDTSNGNVALGAGSNITLLQTKKGELTKYDVSKFELHPDLVARGCNATLFIASDKDGDYLRVTVTTANDPDRHTWIAGTSGQWSVSENWNCPPAGSSDRIAFPESLAEDITVSSSALVKLKHLENDSMNCVTIDVPIQTPTYGTYKVVETNGVLELAGTANLGSPFISKGQGTLRVTGKITGSPEIQADAGRVEGAPECFGTAKLALNNSTVRFTESGTFAGQITHTTTNKNGVGVEVMDGKIVYATGALNNHSALQKTGPGTIVFCRTGTRASVTNVVGQYAKSASTYPYINGYNGAVPNGAALGIYAGKVVFDGTANTRYSVWDTQTWVGQYPIPDGTGGAYDACLEVRGGTLTLTGLLIGIHPKDASMAGTATDIGLTRSQKAIVNVKGGTLRVASGYFVMGYSRYTTSLISELNVSGGLFEACGTGVAGFGIGYHDSSNVVNAAELSSTINISGDGILRKASEGNMRFAVYGTSSDYIHQIALNMTGGRLESPANDLDLLYANNDKASVDANVRVNLAGGVIDVNKITSTKTLGTSRSTIDFHFNGGTYRPNAAESTFPVKLMTSFTVGEGGAKFDLIETNQLTLATQPLVTAEGVEHDGGITLDATGDAVLTLSVSNAFNGPIVVNGGKVVPTVPEAVNCATGVVVNGAGVFDANGLALTFGTLGGDGLYTNGTVTVTDSVEPTGTSLAVESLVLANGATLRCPVTGDAQSGFAAPCFAAGSVSGQGTVWLDLGFAADAPPPHGVVRS